MGTKTTSPQRWIAHVDLDAFFASCEQRDHPEYQGRPVVVGAMPGNRGVVAAASYEARTFGIHSAMPIATAYRLCPHAVYVRPDIEKYRRISREIFALLDQVSPAVEKASIDEAYLDVSGLEGVIGSPATIGQRIRNLILEATELNASVGIGPNRLIAKLGSEACKPNGLLVVESNDVDAFLAPMPVSNLRGLGKRTLPIVEQLGIRTIGDLKNTPIKILQDRLGERTAEKFHAQAHGRAAAHVTAERRRKSISKETTFGTDVTDHDLLHDRLRELAAGVTRTARGEKLAGRVVTLKVRFSGFDTYTRRKTLPAVTNDERTLFSTAWQLFQTSDLPAKPVRLIGVGLSGWESRSAKQDQADMFASNQPDTDERVLAAIDAVTEKFGKPILTVGISRQKDR